MQQSKNVEKNTKANKPSRKFSEYLEDAIAKREKNKDEEKHLRELARQGKMSLLTV